MTSCKSELTSTKHKDAWAFVRQTHAPKTTGNNLHEVSGAATSVHFLGCSVWGIPGQLGLGTNYSILPLLKQRMQHSPQRASLGSRDIDSTAGNGVHTHIRDTQVLNGSQRLCQRSRLQVAPSLSLRAQQTWWWIRSIRDGKRYWLECWQSTFRKSQFIDFTFRKEAMSPPANNYITLGKDSS